MADVKLTMIEGQGKSSAECRERIEMRSLAADNPRRWEKRREREVANPEVCGEKRSRKSGSDPPPPPSPPSPPEQVPPPATNAGTRSTTLPVLSFSEEGGSPDPAIPSVSGSSSGRPPVAFGLVSLPGRSRVMEDAVSVRPGFFCRQDGSPLDFFAVFDGHGGCHVSALCKERMHVLLSEELARQSDSPEDTWRAAVARGFARMDELALAACACGCVGPPPCACDRSGFKSDIVGSTAVVAMVACDRILVANCGDSRAVLSRDGEAIPLSDDHKPDRPDELARIEAAGGRVIFVNGARVHGILAMSRALGDKYLKPEVISDPDIKIVERTNKDECLIIASDGLWDVIPNDLACNVARRCLEESENAVAALDEELVQESDPRCSLAATLLARLALGRMSADNISVIVVDLRRRV
ncbi:probable protein phosphatase 2C 68 [Typha angustifolia]|uniref:probable protein phosphatase 2C 68 n=1 Tax=Typha angustifolia TaxID=59011 RepID=UPI003C2C2439